jgi:hypothetical protein
VRACVRACVRLCLCASTPLARYDGYPQPPAVSLTRAQAVKARSDDAEAWLELAALLERTNESVSCVA